MWPEYIFIYRIYIQIRCCLLWIVFYVSCAIHTEYAWVYVCAIEKEWKKETDCAVLLCDLPTVHIHSVSSIFTKFDYANNFFPWLKSIWTLINVFMFFSLHSILGKWQSRNMCVECLLNIIINVMRKDWATIDSNTRIVRTENDANWTHLQSGKHEIKHM